MRDEIKRDGNKTRSSKIVMNSDGFATIAGHALVVINERDGGKTLQQTVVPGEKFRRPLLARGTLLPYQVVLDDRLRHDFACRLPHIDGVHQFTLNFELRYRVLRESPHLVVMRLDADPLGSIEDEIKRIVGGPLPALDWERIATRPNLSSYAVDTASVDDSGELVVNIERIRIYARGFGIDVRNLAVGRHLDEGDLDAVRRQITHDKDRERDRDLLRDRLEKMAAEKQEEIAKHRNAADLAVVKDKIDIAKEAELADHAVQRFESQKREEAAKLAVAQELDTTRALNNAQVNRAKILEEYTAGIRDAVRGIASSTKSIPDIGVQLRQVKDIAAIAQDMGLNRDTGTGVGLPAGTAGLLGDGNAPTWTAFQGPARNIEDTLARACQIAAVLPASEPQQRRFLATILRLLAARMVEAGDAEIEKHRLELVEIHRAYAQDMREDHSSFVGELARVRRPH